MSAVISTRDPLAKALHEHRLIHDVVGWTCRCGGWKQRRGTLDQSAHEAHVAESLPVIDAATLADDEALRHRLAGKIATAFEGEGEAWPGGDRLASVAADIAARHFIRALAAALSERAS